MILQEFLTLSFLFFEHFENSFLIPSFLICLNRISEPIIVKYDEDKEKEDKPYVSSKKSGVSIILLYSAQPPKEIEMKDMTKKVFPAGVVSFMI